MARVLIADDDPSILRVLRDRLRNMGHEVTSAADGAQALIEAEDADVVLLDLEMPKVSGLTVLESLRPRAAPPAVVILTAHGDVEKAVRAMKAGAVDFLTKPFDAAQIQNVIERALLTRALKTQVSTLEQEVGRRHLWVRGSDPKVQKLADAVARVAASTATVLLLGETGVGKEVIARALHAQSPRATSAFVGVNCAALKRELLESELFGHERGAFTNATASRPGRIEAASGGTLFLDEIGELTLDVQAKLLRVIQEKEYERLGSDKTRRADVRLIAATNRNLQDEVAAGRFREDLYYRINVIALEIPPLRDRPSDIPLLTEFLLERFAHEQGRPPPKVAPAATAALARWTWPGNVRELSNVLERCVLLGGDPIEVHDLPEELAATNHPERAPGGVEPADLPYAEAVAAARRAIVTRALERTNGHQTKAAELLGLTQPYLSRLMRTLGITSRG